MYLFQLCLLKLLCFRSYFSNNDEPNFLLVILSKVFKEKEMKTSLKIQPEKMNEINHKNERKNQINSLRLLLLFLFFLSGFPFLFLLSFSLFSLIFLSFFFVGLLSSYLSYHFILNHEIITSNLLFQLSMKDNIKHIKENLSIKLQINLQNTLKYSLSCSQSKNWPNCLFPSQTYTELNQLLIKYIHIKELFFLPIIKQENKQLFEDYFHQELLIDKNYPNQTAISSFGYGIFEYNKNLQRIRSTNHSIYIPILQVTNLTSSYQDIFENIYTSNKFKSNIDTILHCVASLKQQNEKIIENNLQSLQDIQEIQTKCSSLHSFIDSNDQDMIIIFSPIFPLSNNTNVVGFSATTFSLENFLLSTIKYDSNFFYEIKINTTKLFYSVNNGIVQKSSSASLNQLENQLNRKQQSQNIHEVHNLNDHPSIFSMLDNMTITYYSTENIETPLSAVVVSISCILATLLICSLFLIFDYFITRESQTTQNLLDSKRLFVRFVSHEIR